jgi:acyl-CoA thioesterase FadM
MYKSEIKVKFSDCDAGGRIFFARIFDYAHQIFEEFIHEKCGGYNFFASPDFAVPIIKSTATFHKPILMHSNLSVQLNFSEIKTHSFSVSYSFEMDGILFAEVETVHVFVNKTDGRKTEIPAEIKNLFINYSD